MGKKSTSKIETVFPDNEQHWLELRTENINSTEVAALFGLSPYSTKFELWHRKKEAKVVEIARNDRMKWGTRLEASIAKGIAEDEGWIVRRMEEYLRLPDLRLGASFDYAIGEEALLEVKNVDSLAFRDGWLIDEEEVQAPPHIELQVQTQLMVSGRKKAYIGALVGGNKVVLIERAMDISVTTQIKTKVQDFWKSIEENNPPVPDYIRDAEFISELYQNTDPGKIISADIDPDISDLAFKYKQFAAEMKEAEGKKDGAKAELLTLIGTAEKVLGSGFNISAKIIAGGPVSYIREPYRDFRVTWKKEKK